MLSETHRPAGRWPMKSRLSVERHDGQWGQATAVFSADRRHRFRLTRVWDESLPRCAFVMLNPSSADAFRLDPTNRRCLGFAREWGFGGLDVVNLFSLRASAPADLRRAKRPVRPENRGHLVAAAAEAGLIVAGWGNDGAFAGQARRVCAGPLAGYPLHAIRVTNAGHPGHPLYVHRTATPIPWPGGR